MNLLQAKHLTFLNTATLTFTTWCGTGTPHTPPWQNTAVSWHDGWVLCTKSGPTCVTGLPVLGKSVVNTTVQHVTDDDHRNPDLKTRIEEFNTQLTKCLDDTNFVLASNDIDY